MNADTKSATVEEPKVAAFAEMRSNTLMRIATALNKGKDARCRDEDSLPQLHCLTKDVNAIYDTFNSQLSRREQRGQSGSDIRTETAPNLHNLCRGHPKLCSRNPEAVYSGTITIFA